MTINFEELAENEEWQAGKNIHWLGLLSYIPGPMHPCLSGYTWQSMNQLLQKMTDSRVAFEEQQKEACISFVPTAFVLQAIGWDR